MYIRRIVIPCVKQRHFYILRINLVLYYLDISNYIMKLFFFKSVKRFNLLIKYALSFKNRKFKSFPFQNNVCSLYYILYNMRGNIFYF